MIKLYFVETYKQYRYLTYNFYKKRKKYLYISSSINNIEFNKIKIKCLIN